ncbi:MAG: methyltransferase domain-containing protein [Alphaproteobacteria bacterium]|nr:methyltransferase domain-containing protein [Alphaproteobacteria bacterium]
MTDMQDEFDELNRLAEDYDDGPFDNAMRGYMMRALKPHLRPGKALEMGCFNGAFSVCLAEEYDDLTVVDAVDGFLENVRLKLGDRARTVCSLFEDFETAERFDAIFIVHVLEHLLDPVAVLRKAKSLLAPEGRVFLVVPNGAAASRRIAVKMGVLPTLDALSEADMKHGHRRIYFFDTLVNESRRAGFRISETGGIFFKPLANFQFDGLMGGPLISDSFMEGCFELGKEEPGLSASIFAVCEA